MEPGTGREGLEGQGGASVEGWHALAGAVGVRDDVESLAGTDAQALSGSSLPAVGGIEAWHREPGAAGDLAPPNNPEKRRTPARIRRGFLREKDDLTAVTTPPAVLGGKGWTPQYRRDTLGSGREARMRPYGKRSNVSSSS